MLTNFTKHPQLSWGIVVGHVLRVERVKNHENNMHLTLNCTCMSDYSCTLERL